MATARDEGPPGTGEASSSLSTFTAEARRRPGPGHPAANQGERRGGANQNALAREPTGEAYEPGGMEEDESERRVVPAKQGNPPEETLRREGGAGNTGPKEGKMNGTPSLTDISTRLRRIAELSRKVQGAPLTTLSHHIDSAWMAEAYRRTRKGGAVGVDGKSAADFAENLEENLDALLNALKSGQYRAPPVRRVYIPKADGRERPLGIPTFADKVLQRAVAMLLEAVYEPHFHEASYGFRPGRSAHQALDVLRQTLREMGGGFVIDADIRGYFDTLDHRHLREILDQRVRDGVIVRAIGKWLNAGVMEGGIVHTSETGTPQGGVISPLLANIYLDEVLDQWFEREVRPRLRGCATLVRYADDFVLLFEREDDARKVMDVLPRRFARYGLDLHPEKTRLLDFRHPWRRPTDPDPSHGPGHPRAFDFLGFTHLWKKTAKGGYAVRQQTAGKRLSRASKAIHQWCREHRHEPVSRQHQQLGAKLRGHYQYYDRVGNRAALWTLRYLTVRAWKKWLNRRSQRARMWWDRFNRLLSRYPLPSPTSLEVLSPANP